MTVRQAGQRTENSLISGRAKEVRQVRQENTGCMC